MLSYKESQLIYYSLTSFSRVSWIKSTVILESIRSQLHPVVNEYLGSSVRDLLQKVIQKHIAELMKEIKQEESQKNDIDKAEATDLSTQVKRKHDDQDEDPTVGSDKGKEKKRRRKDTQPSKKPSTSKESFKGKTSSKTSKSGKSVTAEEPNEDNVHDMTLDVMENSTDEMGNADEQLDGEATPKAD
ncbi:hypothetical protein Tco_0998135 [Tanacetum coccineum]